MSNPEGLAPWDELFDADAAHDVGPDKLPLRAHYRVTLGGYIGYWPVSRFEDRLPTASAAIQQEMLLCPATTSARCDVGATGFFPWRGHQCGYDDGHDGAHECPCGHRWAEPDE